MLTKSDQVGKKKQRKVKTPLPDAEKFCVGCGTTINLEIHHCMPGINRENSNKYGCVSWLCIEHHRGTKGVHNGNEELMLRLKVIHQKRLIENGMHLEEFINIFGSNYEEVYLWKFGKI